MPSDILIVPSRGSTTVAPIIQFSGSVGNTIRLEVLPSGSISFLGASGSLFSITDNLQGSLMAVSDISGLPIFEVFSDDRVVMGKYNTNALVVTGSKVGIGKSVPNISVALDVSGSAIVTGSLSVSREFSSNALWTNASSISYWGGFPTAYGVLTWNTGYATVAANTGNNLYLSANGATSTGHITITTNGDIGINKTTANAKLDVNGSTFITGSLSVSSMVTATGLTLLQPGFTTSRIISAPGDITFYSGSTSNPFFEIDSIPSSLSTRISTGAGSGGGTRLILAAESSLYATSTFTLPSSNDIAFTVGTASLNVPLGITSNKESFLNGSLRVGRFAGGVTGAARILVGSERTANGDAYIYLVGDTTYTSYGLGFNRGSTGANATSFIDHRGTGDFTIGSTEAANLIFKTTNSTKMLIAPGGNVGIGTTTPNATLDVSGGLTVSGSFITTGSARIVGDTIITGSLRVTGSARIVGDTIITGSTFISASLSVGPAAAGVVGEIRATNNVTAYYSDERLKTRFGNIENPIEKIMAISGFYFEPNELAQQLGYIKKKEVGVSAQEVNAVLPEVIAPAPIDEKYMTVRYEKMVPLLIEAIKDQQKQIDGLKNKFSL